MSIKPWTLLDQITSNLQKPSDFPPALMYSIAERMEESISAHPKEHVTTLAKQLTDLFQTLITSAPKPAADAARNINAYNGSEGAAFLLGQAAFAQLMASQVASKRVDDTFFERMNHADFKKYIQALKKKDLTGKDLARELAMHEGTVSRKLQILREEGICDFRREGTHFVNFLTPAARAVLDESSDTIGDEDALSTLKLTKLKSTLPIAFQKTPIFSECINDESR